MRSATINQQSVRRILVALSLPLVSCSPATDRILEETIEQSYKIEPTASIRIKNGDGSIRIYGADTNEMRLQAIKRAYAAKRLKQIAVPPMLHCGGLS